MSVYTPLSKGEADALLKCDAILEGLQDYLRGGCNVKEIRALIRRRLNGDGYNTQSSVRFLTATELHELERQKDKADCLWGILVMLKRGFDPHVNNTNKLQIDKSDWEEASRRARQFASI